MKKYSFFVFTILVLVCSCKTNKSDNKLATYNGLAMIKAKSTLADYRIGDEWLNGAWTISPEIENDSLIVSCYSDSVSFSFRTDVDSISLNLKPGQAHKFYASLNDSVFALTIVKAIKPNYSDLKFDTESKANNLKFWYEQNNNNEYLNLLRSKYPIDSLINGLKTDTEKTMKILNWVHNQWAHNGGNQPIKNDAISILEEVKEGKNFRCVEYGIVASACLNAIGLKTRTLALKTKDVETREFGAGHVLSEVFLNDLNKWVLIDGQWDAMPVLDDKPLNAVEFQKAIANNYEKLEIRTSSNLSKRNYVEWIYPYLYYFDISFDNREGLANGDKNNVEGKSHLMLVPLDESNPTVFQINNKIDYCIYTNSVLDFYDSPLSNGN